MEAGGPVTVRGWTVKGWLGRKKGGGRKKPAANWETSAERVETLDRQGEPAVGRGGDGRVGVGRWGGPWGRLGAGTDALEGSADTDALERQRWLPGS